MEKDTNIKIRISNTKKEQFAKALRQRKTTMSVWVRKQIDNLIEGNA
jgi:hypothetical protein